MVRCPLFHFGRTCVLAKNKYMPVTRGVLEWRIKCSVLLGRTFEWQTNHTRFWLSWQTITGRCFLADRGLNMTEDFAFKGAQLIVPAYTEWKCQLLKEDVEKSRMMSRARIHIGRVIGRLKNFEIIKGPLPNNLVKSKKKPFEKLEQLKTEHTASIQQEAHGPYRSPEQKSLAINNLKQISRYQHFI